MMVIFTSRSEKKSLMTVRRILDQFADRIGNDTWQTLITKEGLETVYTLLRKSATKSTAVSCRWIRSRSRCDLLWIVGNRDKFNTGGIVPVNTTQKNILHKEWEGGWPYLPQMKALTAVAALFHDWGKASNYFQRKLRHFTREKDPFRHEWMSCKMLEAVARLSKCEQDDSVWITALLEGRIHTQNIEAELQEMQRDKTISKAPYDIPPLMQLLLWPILTHHRMPTLKRDHWLRYENDEPASPRELMKKITASWNYQGEGVPDECLKFQHGILSEDDHWQQALQDRLAHLLKEKDTILQIVEKRPEAVRPILLLIKESLMLADHSVSSKKKPEPGVTLYANTDGGELCESLSHHLVAVSQQAVRIIRHLPLFAKEMDCVEYVRFPRAKGPYRWQDKAVEKIRQSREAENASAYFVLNMASTGCGKTTANAKIMQALSEDGKSMRYTLALGLRSLTLQTGAEYRERMHLDNSALAVIIGSSAVQSLDEQNRQKKTEKKDSLAWQKQDRQEKSEKKVSSISQKQEYGGSGEEELLSESLHFEDAFSTDQLEYLDIFLNGDKNRQSKKNEAYLFKPVLVSTIDQIIGVTEATRGGRGLLPFLRLLSSDLVIDEIDDFSPEDLTAIARLVHLVGMFGRNIVLSSATIPPDLAIGLYQAYADGLFCYNAFADTPKVLQAVWVDEFRSACRNLSKEHKPYADLHEAFIQKRVEKLGEQIVKRQGKILTCQPQNTKEEAWNLYVKVIQQAVLDFHEKHHVVDKKTEKTVSFGLLRFANIDPCVNMAISLAEADWPDGTAVYLMCYHSRQVLLLRHEQEKYLDSVLKRKDQQGDVVDLKDQIVREKLDATKASKVVFLVVSTPVEEIGRDHDFDWAIIEPSSYRSIIQLAGRIRRHRPLKQNIDNPNIGILEYNWLGMQSSDEKSCVFIRPGFEQKCRKYQLRSHDIRALVPEKEWQRIDAIPRIVKNNPLHAKESLIDLEHKRLEDWRSLERKGPDTMGGWQQTCWWMTGLPQVCHPFRAGSSSIELCYQYEEKRGLRFCNKPDDKYRPCEDLYAIEPCSVNQAAAEHLWLPRDYMVLLQQQAEREEFSDEATDAECLQKTSERYGQLMLSYYDEQSPESYCYSDQLGLFKKFEWVYNQR